MRPDDFLPLSAADFQLLVILMEEERHAYGIAQAAEARAKARVPLGLGSLYRMLYRLEEQGMIDEDPTPRPSPSGPERKVYRITELGRAVVAAETRRLRETVEWAEARLGAEGQAG